MSTFFAAPYPTIKVTSVLPDAEFGDGRKSESSVDIKRTMIGRVITYIKTSAKQTLTLTFQLTRMKDLELDQFIQSFHTTEWQLTLHDGSIWRAKLVGEPIKREAFGRVDFNNDTTGNEELEVTLTFSAEKLN